MGLRLPATDVRAVVASRCLLVCTVGRVESVDAELNEQLSSEGTCSARLLSLDGLIPIVISLVSSVMILTDRFLLSALA